MGYTKIKKFNDSFESLNSLAYGEDFLREYNNLCNLANSLCKNKKSSNTDKIIPDTNTLYGYINYVVVPTVSKLPDYAEHSSSLDKIKIIKDTQLLTQNLYKIARLWSDKRFEDSYTDLMSSFNELFANFTKEDIDGSFFKNTGLNSFMDMILKLSHNPQEISLSPVDKLVYYNLYPELQYFKKEVVGKSDVFSRTKNNLLYEEVLNGNRNYKDEMLAIARLIHKSINGTTKNKSTLKIDGLKHPVKWENITILFDGETLMIKQSDTRIAGELFLEDIGINKARKKGAKTSSFTFFTSLFISIKGKEYELDSKNNLNQQNKMAVSKTLKDLFDTPEDPIYILDNKYVPKFKASPCGPLAELNVDQYRSGRTLYENDIYAE